MVALIEALCMDRPTFDVAFPCLSTAATGEVVDTFLRSKALVKMLVAREYDIDAVFNKDRLQLLTQSQV